MSEPEDELGEEDYHRMMKYSRNSHPDLQPIEDNFQCRLGRKLLCLVRFLYSLDFFDDKISRSFVRSRGQKNANKGLPRSAKWLRYFIIYFGTVKLVVLLYLKSGMDVKWYNLKGLLANCSGLNQQGEFVHSLDPGPLIMNKAPRKLYLPELPDYSNATLGLNEYNCQQSSVSKEKLIKLTNEMIQRLLEDFLKAHKYIWAVGDSMRNKNFPLECFTIFAISILLLTYIIPLLMIYHWGTQIDFSFMRMALAIEAECWNNFELVRQQVNMFIRSSRGFAHIDWQKSANSWLVDPELADNNELKTDSNKNGLMRRKGESFNARTTRMLEHINTVGQLKELAISGNLQPVNKSRFVIEYNIKVFNIFFITLATICISFAIISLNVATWWLISVDYELAWEPRDILFHVECTVFMIVSCQSGMFLLAYCIVNCIDQLNYAHKLRELIRQCKREIIANQLRLDEMLNNELNSDASGSVIAFELKMNSIRSRVKTSLLCTLMRYKIFAAQFQPIKKSLSILSGIFLVHLMIAPLIDYAYQDYLDSNLRSLGVVCSLLLGLASDLVLIPLCQLNHRCANLYKELSGLLAHAVEIIHPNGERGNLGSTRKVFGKTHNNDYILWSLRRELEFSEQMVDSFKVTLFGLKISYASILKVHYYLGIIILPIILHSELGGRHIFGSNYMNKQPSFQMAAE